MSRWVTTAATIRRKQRRRRILSFCIQALFCVGLYSATAYGFSHFVKTSGDFHVSKVRIEGISMLGDDALLSTAGVTSADSIFALDAPSVGEKLRQIPFVEQCQVVRVFPDIVTYRVDEREALATIMVNNHLYEVDRQGNVLRELQPEQQHTGPLITEIAELGSVEVGTQITAPALHWALDVWCAFAKTEMAKSVTVSEICAADEDRLAMYVDELRCEIRWSRSQFDKQARKLDIFWQNLEGHIPYTEYVDLRFANDVACR